jgi:hypothetical protein
MRDHRGSIHRYLGMDARVLWPSGATCHAQPRPRKVQSALKTQGEKLEEKTVSSDTKRSTATNLRSYGVPRAIRGCQK